MQCPSEGIEKLFSARILRIGLEAFILTIHFRKDGETSFISIKAQPDFKEMQDTD